MTRIHAGAGTCRSGPDAKSPSNQCSQRLCGGREPGEAVGSRLRCGQRRWKEQGTFCNLCLVERVARDTEVAEKAVPVGGKGEGLDEDPSRSTGTMRGAKHAPRNQDRSSEASRESRGQQGGCRGRQSPRLGRREAAAPGCSLPGAHSRQEPFGSCVAAASSPSQLKANDSAKGAAALFPLVGTCQAVKHKALSALAAGPSGSLWKGCSRHGYSVMTGVESYTGTGLGYPSQFIDTPGRAKPEHTKIDHCQ